MKNRLTNYLKQNMLTFVPAILLLQAFILMLFAECITFYDFDIPYRWVDIDNLFFMFYNTAIYFLLLLLIFCLSKKLFPGYIALSIIVTIFSIINNMKWNQLKECVSFADISKLSEAVTVGKGVEFLGVPRLIAGLIILVLCGIPLLIFDKKNLKGKMRKVKDLVHSCRFATPILAIAFIVFIRIDWNNSALERITENRTADITGPMVYFVESMEKVLCEDSYTDEEALSVYNKYVELGKNVEAPGDGIHPNVIVIMSEAFYDVNLLKGAVSYSKDPMYEYNQVAAEGISGLAAANIYGGSTHYSEFEFLTGWNTRGMSLGGCPYKEYFDEFQPSVVKYFEDAGYETMAIHPYEKWFWNRDGAYGSMGFDSFIGREDMKYTDMCGYISDEALTKEIIYRYEDREEKDKPFFCFSVSMANHIARINDDYKENSPEQIDVRFGGKTSIYSQSKKKRIKHHVSGMEKSGEALRELVDYYKTVEEPTVILFFGDHAPSYALELLKAGQHDEAEAYATPFLIWSNYDITENADNTTAEKADNAIVDKADNEASADNIMDKLITGEDGKKMISISDLSVYMIAVLGMPMPTQGYYDIGIMKDYPVETRYLIKSADSVPFEEYSKERKRAYIERAKELKGCVNALLEEPSKVKDIWNYPE